ncbi:Aldo/keto reductase family protein [Paenibacillus sophorae]|uniref:Aldo/keto reductase family protein n=1 Tax=Paenibacillus sophorae TaxID=1333845 RepID=A0A1H8FGR8_9BACL|nr:Aldo/keto reductase family protein [Paenibacillus sophorae]
MTGMQYVRLGNTGMEVSRLTLGCMSYGVPERGNHEWTLNEEQSRPFIQRALELGINFFDTAKYLLGWNKRGNRRQSAEGLRRPG